MRAVCSKPHHAGTEAIWICHLCWHLWMVMMVMVRWVSRPLYQIHEITHWENRLRMKKANMVSILWKGRLWAGMMAQLADVPANSTGIHVGASLYTSCYSTSSFSSSVFFFFYKTHQKFIAWRIQPIKSQECQKEVTRLQTYNTLSDAVKY